MFSSILGLLLFSAVFLEDASAFPQNNRITEADGFIFDGPADRPPSRPLGPGRNVDGSTQPPQTSSTSAPQTTPQPPLDMQRFNTCLNSCPVTSEYNPVCGTDNVQYRNPGSLKCATVCGKNVTLNHYGACTVSGTRG